MTYIDTSVFTTLDGVDMSDFGKWWASLGQTIGKVAASAAWQARQQEIDALKAENAPLRKVFEGMSQDDIDELAKIPNGVMNLARYAKDAAKECDALREELELCYGTLKSRERNIESLKAENERLRKDAERLDLLERSGIELRVRYDREEEDVFIAYRVTGFPNDLEYTEVGRGVTVRRALDSAIASEVSGAT